MLWLLLWLLWLLMWLFLLLRLWLLLCWCKLSVVVLLLHLLWTSKGLVTPCFVQVVEEEETIATCVVCWSDLLIGH